MSFKKKYDVVVVGGGILGAFATYYLSQAAPEWNIIVVDKAIVGSGTSDYSLGVHFPFGHTKNKQEQTEQSMKEWDQLMKLIPNFSVTPHTCLAIVPEKGKEDYLQRIISKGWKILDNSQKRARLKQENLTIENQRVVVASIPSWRCPVGDLAKKVLLEQCLPNTTISEGVTVKRYQKKNHEILVETSIGKILHSDKLLLTVGPWFKDLQSSIAINYELPQQKTKKIVTLTINLSPPPQASLIYMFENDSFLLPDFKYNRYLFSYTSYEWDCFPNINQLYLTSDLFENGKVILKEYSPIFAKHVTGGRVFCDAYFEDFTPRIYTDPKHQEIMGIFGASGSGFRLAPALAKTVSNRLTNRSHTQCK